MIEEFKKFIMRGNVLDMAIGIIIGAAFGNFSNLFLNLSSTPAATLAEARDAGLPVIAYGSFLNAVVDFLIVAFAIFLLIKQVNRLMPKKEAKAARLCPYCRQEIADDATRCPHCTSELPAEKA